MDNKSGKMGDFLGDVSGEFCRGIDDFFELDFELGWMRSRMMGIGGFVGELWEVGDGNDVNDGNGDV